MNKAFHQKEKGVSLNRRNSLIFQKIQEMHSSKQNLSRWSPNLKNIHEI